MRYPTKLNWLIACGLLLAAIPVARSQQGELAPVRPAPMPFPRHTPPFWLPPIQTVLRIESIRVDARIVDGVATNDVTQVWRNDTDRPQEGSYLFPVPEGTTLSDFALYDGDRRMDARLLDKDAASQTYEDIVRHLRDPAILRYAGHNTYEVRLYPVPPRETRKITLKYSAVLPAESDKTRKFDFPFLADTGDPAGVKPASANVTVAIEDSEPLANIYSPLGDISVHRQGDHKATVSWEGNGDKVRGDFLLYYSRAQRDPVGLSLLAYNVSLPGAKLASHAITGDGKRDSGYFLLMASPRTEIADTQILPKNVVLVLDRSGSMAGPKIEQARGALSFVLKNLRPTDRFNVLSFNESVDQLSTDGLLAASEDNIKRGQAFVKDINAEGGTNIHDALDTALRLFPAEPSPGRQNLVIFLTDGLPTVGETDDAKITEAARTLTRARDVRLFDFGVGYDVDVHFLDRLAQRNKGDSDYVRPEEDIEAKVSRFYAKVASPVLTDVHLAIDGIDSADIYPRPSELPDLFEGSQLLVVGRYAGSGPVTAHLTGAINGKRADYTLTTSLPAVADADDFLPRLWATRKIGYLLDAIRLRETEGDAHSVGGSQELIDEVTRLSKEYGIVTPYTSFLVTETNEGQPPIRFEQPIAMDAMGGGGGFANRSGAAATTQSQSLHAAKAANAPAPSFVGGALSESDTKTVAARSQVVGARTFFLRGDTWTDSAYDPDKQTKLTTLTAFSSEYFDWLKAHPDLAPTLALGERIIVVIDENHAVRVVPEK